MTNAQASNVGTDAPAGSELRLSTAEGNSSAWFTEHYHHAADQVIDFLASAGVTITGRRLADIGCGDGIIDLGVAHKARPEALVGFDIVPTDVGNLARLAETEGVGGTLPENLRFQTCQTRSLPADDGSFDLVFSWSAFEHMEDPRAMCEEIRRVMRPEGVLMLQLWPFFASEHGAHLWQCIPDAFVQLLWDEERIGSAVRAASPYSTEQTEDFLQVYSELNRVSLDDLQRALLGGGLWVTKVELLSHTVHIPRELARRSLTDLAIAGVKLLAVPC